MNRLMHTSTVARFKSDKLKLDWAEKNLDADTYNRIKKSYNDIIKYTLIVTIALLIIVFIIIVSAFCIQDSARSTYDTWKRGHVSGDKLWYINNEKYEIELSYYEVDPVDYSDGDIFRVGKVRA